MKFQVHSDIEYNVKMPSTLIFNIHALRTAHQTILEETLTIDPFYRIEEFKSSHSENRFVRLAVTEPTVLKVSYKATVDTYYKEIDFGQAGDVPVIDMDGDILPFIFPSRYCQSDKLIRLANDKFGNIQNQFAKVQAIADWINHNVDYLSGATNSQTSAFDTVTERAGVCRDFAHLGIALCRALSIPARYFTGYAYQLNPPDFHACFEAFIGGHWIIFDATKLAPLNGLVKIANGRDAADAAIMTSFGNVKLNSMVVGCELADEGFVPYHYDPNVLKGISFNGR